eukprot:CAMPEP_0181291096 /NCGR_PEP_ID=MMETSP1101-20121128/1777_1 /TAXON_ID=46948 /ORGANISM="Rhodomonas abbreviata, Strain Caron Lab Isolate" /LENGTH=1598 /DNA_ID=CAMNT_0023395449 /DNA_START=240 /DNA_END=5032 /DNA_ORIENTATION=-
MTSRSLTQFKHALHSWRVPIACFIITGIVFHASLTVLSDPGRKTVENINAVRPARRTQLETARMARRSLKLRSPIALSSSFLAQIKRESEELRRSDTDASDNVYAADAVGHYLVRVVPDRRAAVRQQLGAAGSGLLGIQALPTDAFLVTLTASMADEIAKTKGVKHVLNLPMEMKATPDLLSAALATPIGNRRMTVKAATRGQDESSPRAWRFGGRGSPDLLEEPEEWIVIDVSVGNIVASTEGARALARLWESALRAVCDEGSVAGVSAGSAHRLSVRVRGEERRKVVRFLLVQAEPLWMEERKVVRPRKNFAVDIVRGGEEGEEVAEPSGPVGGEDDNEEEVDVVPADPGSEQDDTEHGSDSNTDLAKKRFLAAGLRGQGEIVGIADNGVDYDSCFFRDHERAVPVCWESSITGGCMAGDLSRLPVDMSHRKIVSYRVLGYGDDYQEEAGGRGPEDGHGTELAGIVAGQVVSPSPGDSFNIAEELANAAEYNGIAPEAKLVIDDISHSGLPDDLGALLWPYSYALGARVHLNAWGDDDPYYSIAAQELDSFVYTHDDFVVVVAGGNTGPDPITIGSPATAKNAIVVGGTQNHLDSYSAYPDSASLRFELTQVPATPTVVGSGAKVVVADFGAKLKLTAPLEGGLVEAKSTTGCLQNITNAREMEGRIALAWREPECEYVDQVLALETAGAIAVMIMNFEQTTFVMPSYRGAPEPSIPAVLISSDTARVTLSMVDQNRVGQVFVRFPTTDTGLRETFSPTQSSSHGEYTLTDFSSRGPTPDGRLKPDVVAPAENIRTATTSDGVDANQCAVGATSGTSMAAAFVAGAAALVRQYFREGHYGSLESGGREEGSFAPSAALVKAMILNSGQPLRFVPTEKVQSLGQIKGFVPQKTLPQVEQGYGLVQLDKVLDWKVGDSDKDAPQGLVVRDREVMHDGGLFTMCVERTSAVEPLKVTLVWTDPPGAPVAVAVLVNDLDLTVTGPEGNVLLGNHRVSRDAMNGEHHALDKENNNEQVTVSGSDVGEFRIRVLGADVPQGPQKFSLVLSGSMRVLESCSEQGQCPLDCSGIGTCVHGRCACPLSHRGVGCEVSNVQLTPYHDVKDRVSIGGWSYYLWEVEDGAAWRVQVLVDSQWTDPDLFLAKGRLPTMRDYDDSILEGVGQMDQGFVSTGRSEGKGTWVLGVMVFCCYDAGFTVRLTPDDRKYLGDGASDPGQPSDDDVAEYPGPESETEVILFAMTFEQMQEDVFEEYEEDYRHAVADVAKVQVDAVNLYSLDTEHATEEEGRRANAAIARLSVVANHSGASVARGVGDENAEEEEARQENEEEKEERERAETEGEQHDQDTASVQASTVPTLRVWMSVLVEKGTARGVWMRISTAGIAAALHGTGAPPPAALFNVTVLDFLPDVAEDNTHPPVASGADTMSDEVSAPTVRRRPLIPILAALGAFVVMMSAVTAWFFIVRKKDCEQGSARARASASVVVTMRVHSHMPPPSAPPLVDAAAVVRGVPVLPLSPASPHLSRAHGPRAPAAGGGGGRGGRGGHTAAVSSGMARVGRSGSSGDSDCPDPGAAEGREEAILPAYEEEEVLESGCEEVDARPRR